MGGCLSIHSFIGLRSNQGLQESTFSHYSLSSESSYLDLYPTFHYVECNSSSTDDDVVSSSHWRRSSVPLLDEETDEDSDEDGPYFQYSFLQQSSSRVGMGGSSKNTAFSLNPVFAIGSSLESSGVTLQGIKQEHS
eukprot:TRINITY_DN2414_c0_g1_i2.p1 TRINITY_DN2414_c0_g1~~TRINITY_DN2414_c0_g1_i2.p1  ORF type:complete len:136 (+),score=35.05 TRINITY_DN2414_c0_g1_i2:618-1025(+)